MKIIFFGTPVFAIPSLDALVKTGESIISVISQPDKPKGRGHILSPPPVKEYSFKRGIPVIQPTTLKSKILTEKLLELSPDLIVVIAYGKIIPPSILNIPLRGCINVHASLLPKYRGAAPIQWTLINGEKISGVTTMFMDEGLDTGSILLQESLSVSDDDTAETLGNKLAHLGSSVLLKTVEALKMNSLKPKPQSGDCSYAPPLKKENGRINWSCSAERINNLIRGTHPWPGAFCYINDKKITVIKAKLISSPDIDPPGKILRIGHDGVYVGTGFGILSILEVKPEGKKEMTATEFAHGRHIKAGVFFDVA